MPLALRMEICTLNASEVDTTIGRSQPLAQTIRAFDFFSNMGILGFTFSILCVRVFASTKDVGAWMRIATTICNYVQGTTKRPASTPLGNQHGLLPTLFRRLSPKYILLVLSPRNLCALPSLGSGRRLWRANVAFYVSA